MRIVKHPQAYFGQVDIAEINFDARSRDDIPALLKGLQYIYVTEGTRNNVFRLLGTHSTQRRIKWLGARAWSSGRYLYWP